jgi:hypothetical protein
MNDDPISKPLQFRNLTVNNRIFRSSISGKFDNYDGSGPTQARINWEEKCFVFARRPAKPITVTSVARAPVLPSSTDCSAKPKNETARAERLLPGQALPPPMRGFMKR